MTKLSWRLFAEIVVLIAVIVGGGTFVYKLIEFARTAGSEEMPGFAVVSVVPYFAATIGFLLLAVWAFLRGHFKDIEEPKYRMIEQEEKYDRAEEESLSQS